MLVRDARKWIETRAKSTRHGPNAPTGIAPHGGARAAP
jgi:hypothetical protein